MFLPHERGLVFLRAWTSSLNLAQPMGPKVNRQALSCHWQGLQYYQGPLGGCGGTFWAKQVAGMQWGERYAWKSLMSEDFI